MERVANFMFNIEEDKEFISKYIEPGIHEDITIDSFEWEEPENGPPSVRVKLYNSQGQTAEDRFSYSEKAARYSNIKIKHMWDRFYTTAELEKIVGQSNNDMYRFISLLNQKLSGKTFKQFKFSGKEIEGKDGKPNWFKATIGLPNFCSTDFSPRKLSFDPNSKYDMNRLESHSHISESNSPKW
jgi:hypothetical protein